MSTEARTISKPGESESYHPCEREWIASISRSGRWPRIWAFCSFRTNNAVHGNSRTSGVRLPSLFLVSKLDSIFKSQAGIPNNLGKALSAQSDELEERFKNLEADRNDPP